ncbi:MAG: 16S rRNA (guanine(527)-N(7))-methyltransferase RsmG [Mangrovicoccus sp.]
MTLQIEDVSRETAERLEIYAALVAKWNPKINLVSKLDLPHVKERHILDSWQVTDLVPANLASWADFGSGGGFPGLVIAIWAAETQPQMEITLVESDQRKATFLRTVSRETNLRVKVLDARIESIPPLGVQGLSARALAPLPQLLSYAERHLLPGGVALFPKGRRYQQEIGAAQAEWSFPCQAHPSKTDPEAVILEIGHPRRA